MPFDEMSDKTIREMAQNQREGWRNHYSTQDNEEMDRRIREQERKKEFLNLLRTDRNFRREVKNIINSDS